MVQHPELDRLFGALEEAESLPEARAVCRRFLAATEEGGALREAVAEARAALGLDLSDDAREEAEAEGTLSNDREHDALVVLLDAVAG
jgi:hypothetical protein